MLWMAFFLVEVEVILTFREECKRKVVTKRRVRLVDMALRGVRTGRTVWL